MNNNRFLNFMRNFFKTRSVGFYVLLGGIVLSLIEAIVYYVSYAMQNEYAEYFSLAAFIIVFVAIIVTIALSLFETTERFAAVVFCAFEICIFFLFVEKTYLYLPTVFYHGFSAVALASLYPGFTACL